MRAIIEIDGFRLCIVNQRKEIVILLLRIWLVEADSNTSLAPGSQMQTNSVTFYSLVVEVIVDSLVDCKDTIPSPSAFWVWSDDVEALGNWHFPTVRCTDRNVAILVCLTSSERD